MGISKGYLGQLPGGFPEPLRSRVLKNKKPIEGRPGWCPHPRPPARPPAFVSF